MILIRLNAPRKREDWLFAEILLRIAKMSADILNQMIINLLVKWTFEVLELKVNKEMIVIVTTKIYYLIYRKPEGL